MIVIEPSLQELCRQSQTVKSSHYYGDDMNYIGGEDDVLPHEMAEHNNYVHMVFLRVVSGNRDNQRNSLSGKVAG
ncbi:MAG: hypothetical protein ABIJ50_00670 [Pseudomonadota bacterium]